MLILCCKMDLRTVPYNSKRQGHYQWKLVAQACCTTVQLPGDLLPGFLDFTLCFLPQSHPMFSTVLSPHRWRVSSGLGLLFSGTWDCADSQGWTHRRGLANPFWSDTAWDLPLRTFICCLHSMYPNSLWRVEVIAHISYFSPSPAPWTSFLAEVNIWEWLAELMRAIPFIYTAAFSSNSQMILDYY